MILPKLFCYFQNDFIPCLKIVLMSKTMTHGGKRNGAGRKSLNGKKKESVFMYIPGDEVAAVGGREIAKTIGEQAVSVAAQKKLKKTS